MNNRPNQNFSDKERESLELALLLCDDCITAEQAQQLEANVLADLEIRRMFVQLMKIHAGLYRYATGLGAIDDQGLDLADERGTSSETVNLHETMVLPAFNPLDEMDTVSEAEFTPPVTSFQHKKVNRFQPMIKWITAALIPIAIALCSYLAHLKNDTAQRRPVLTAKIAEPLVVVVVAPLPVAILDVEQFPVWADGFIRPADGRFIAGQSISLKTGVIQLQMKRAGSGRLVIEGPADLDLVSSSEINVRQGNFVVEAPGGGFVVRCPTGKVTDLGTEFGVSVHLAGEVKVAVFEGRVAASLISSTPGSVSTEHILTIGQAATISQNAIKVDAEGAVPQRFICNLHNDALMSLDVVDLIAGGDGTTHRRGIAVSSIDGQIGALLPVGARRGDGKFHAVHGFPVVDGAFVPDGSRGPNIVDSIGDSFQFNTAGNGTFNHIWTGGPIPWLNANQFSTQLNGIDYAQLGHGLVCLHSNSAITLDLQAVRRIYPDRDVNRFHTQFGNSYVTGWNGDPKVTTTAGFYVLVDGKCCYQKPVFSHTDGTLSVDLPLARTDRFLTVASTDAGISADHDWILMADPKLDFAAAK